MDPIRRKLLKTGAAAAAMAATPPALFARQSGNDDSGRFYERGNVRIRYEETGSGFPLLLISGGGLNGSTIAGIRRGNPFSTIEAFSGEFRCLVRLVRKKWIAANWGPSNNNRKARFYSITKAVGKGRVLQPATRS